MSKMGNELDRLLDENKYAMWKLLQEASMLFELDSTWRVTIGYRIKMLLSKIENGGE